MSMVLLSSPEYKPMSGLTLRSTVLREICSPGGVGGEGTPYNWLYGAVPLIRFKVLIIVHYFNGSHQKEITIYKKRMDVFKKVRVFD